MKSNDQNKYRLNVGIMIINSQGLIWMGKRRHTLSSPFSYQMPQGGIDPGETPEQTLWRELYEEVGLSQNECKVLAVSKNWYTYLIPPEHKMRSKYAGQKQKWFLLQLTCPDETVCLNKTDYPEFSSFKWMTPEEAKNAVIPFKREVYQKVLAEFAPYLNAMKNGEINS